MQKNFILNENFDFRMLKTLSTKELELLSSQIKELIIDRCSEFGGHLSSNLGVTNLTIALFKAFNLDEDKVILDIGHFGYTYKILTGRPLKKLRLENGTDGFLKRSESKYDIYDAGHSSTAISAAIGFGKIRDLENKNYECIAFIGDGGISNGISFEALNNILVDDTKIIIILNDNEMSISPAVGGLHNLLSALKSDNSNNTKLDYYGPVDGNDFEKLEEAFEYAKKSKKSVLIHCKTTKGRGYSFAKDDEIGEFHFVAPFYKESGEPKINPLLNKKSLTETFANLVNNEMKENPKTFAICPSTTVGSKLVNLFNTYKNRCFDFGISEEHSAIVASALGINDYHVYLFMYSTFLQRAYDEILHDIAREDSKVTILIDRAGLVGPDGETHQGIYDDGFIYSIPNLSLAMPKDEIDAQILFNLAKNYDHPFAIRFPSNYSLVDINVPHNYQLEFGSWEYLIEGKSDKCIISFGPHILSLFKEFKDSNITLINALFLKDFNSIEIQKLARFNKIYIYDPYGIEEGFSSKLLLMFNKFNIKSEVKIKALPLEFISKGTIEEQEKRMKVDLTSVIDEIKVFFK